ncbi:MAG: VirB8/TrbF family protein [Rickettsiaceae bacterium]|nr:VirB8/TrbF family protein [Rickettsiaceae bacterium]
MLQAIKDTLFKKNTEPTNESEYSTSLKSTTWYQDRYDTVKTQRNLLLIIVLISLLGIVASIVVVGKISTSKTFSPFVIQIEERTGFAKVVNPANSDLLSANDSLGRYLIKKYISARETYNSVDFENNFKKVVKIFSSIPVYKEYVGYIKKADNDPTILYGQKNSTYIKVKSITKLRDTFFVRFSITETQGSQRTFDKVATITFDYIPMELKDEDRDINPVGFQVTGYRVEDDKG